MNYKKTVLPVIGNTIIAVSLLLHVAFASSAQPGSSDDPVVTKSYVDKKISEAVSSSSSGGQLSDYQLAFIIDEVVEALSSGEGLESAPTSMSYTPVKILTGQVIVGEEGTEMILRSGSAVGYTESSDGLVNATTGMEIVNGTAIAVNNLLIVPRDDGRGIRATSDAWLIVKGGYEVNQPIFYEDE